MDERTSTLLERLQGWADGRPAGPYKILVNPTNRCNLACVSCLARGKPEYRPEREVPTERYLTLVREAKSLGALYCDICGGGEPFARPETTLAIMREVKAQGMTGMVLTNGTLLSEDTLREIVEMGWDEFNISIDGPTAEINDYLRGKGTFNKIIRTVEILNRWKSKLRANLPSLSFFTVVSRKNYRNIGGFLELATRLHIDGLYLQPVTVSEGRGQVLVMSEEEVSEFQKEIDNLKQMLPQTGIKSNVEFIDSGLLKHASESGAREEQHCNGTQISCHHPWLMAVIDAEGAAGLCPGSVPNIFKANIKTQTLTDIWHGREFNGFREKILANERPPCCDNCGSMETIANREITAGLRARPAT